ncbi:MAG: toll/interleukin-1 receptor domain-containing protein [Paludibacteraceae bacterium]|nr:toll/interleukin-1 receptor domain-containing protein [Paludibacteraceae bacterium]
MIKPIDIKTNPTELLNLLYENQEMLYQKFDIFLSHSSFDTKELLRLKCHLNSLGKVVYIDWVNDRIMLNRKYQNDDTWPALELRMSQSDVLLYVLTDNAIRSPYTEREVNYFKKQKKQVLIYQPGGILLKVPGYLKGCEYCLLNNNKPMV